MSERRPLPDRVADVVFYGPLGLVLEHRKLLPQLARRGRRQVAFTRTIGRFTVQQGRSRIENGVADLVSRIQPDPGPERPEPAATSPPPTAGPEPAPPPEGAAAPDPAGLSIPQYDSLSAIQVVPRLEGLDPAERRAIHDYETATRGRRTILAKIDQLDDGTAP